MTWIRASFISTLLVITASAVDSPSLTGKWEIHRSAQGNDSVQECTLAQKESELTGTCKDDRATVAISGKVEGKAVTMTYKGDSQGGPVTVTYKGTVQSADKFTGKVTALEFAVEGDFTATRMK